MTRAGSRKGPLIALGLAAAAVSAFIYAGRRFRWNAGHSENDGTLLFKPDLTPHPGHYSLQESLEILGQVSPIRMITDPMHWKEYPGIYRFTFDRKYGARIGAPAPDFDLPTADGKRLRLSDLRGKNVALMFSAET